jgi:hypothetical protein
MIRLENVSRGELAKIMQHFCGIFRMPSDTKCALFICKIIFLQLSSLSLFVSQVTPTVSRWQITMVKLVNWHQSQKLK